MKETFINASPETVFGFHELPDAFERLVPPWEQVKVLQKAVISEIGSKMVLEQKIFGLIPSKWVAEHTRYEPPKLFEDVQISGPFSKWRHLHRVEPKDGGAVLIDEIDYEPPLSFIGKLADPILLRPKIQKMFDHRHKVTKEWCEAESKKQS